MATPNGYLNLYLDRAPFIIPRIRQQVPPEIVAPDNLKSGVTKACRYEPSVNRTRAISSLLDKVLPLDDPIVWQSRVVIKLAAEGRELEQVRQGGCG